MLDEETSEQKKFELSRGMRAVTVILLFAITALLVAITALLAIEVPREERSLVAKNKPQVVFLDNDLIYFGRVQTITSKYMIMSKAQYLKPDCTLEQEKPKVIINRDSVVVWENLQDEDHIVRTLNEIAEFAEATGRCVAVPNNGAETPQPAEEPQEPEEETGPEDETDPMDEPRGGDTVF